MRSISSRTTSTLMVPASGSGASVITSGCIPRAMRLQAAHVPQASSASVVPFEPGTPSSTTSVRGSRQLSACASATAVRRFPTPRPPVNRRLGGSDRLATARARRRSVTRWPTMSRKGMGPLKIKGIVAQQGIGRD